MLLKTVLFVFILLASVACDVLSVAQGWLQVPYLSAGKTKEGIDCSYFVYKVFGEAGMVYEFVNTKNLPTSPSFEKVAVAMPGDVVLFKKDGPQSSVPNHMGIVTADTTQFIGANGKCHNCNTDLNDLSFKNLPCCGHVSMYDKPNE
jgi:cell wall-associated NlpC family hydrolase